MLIIEGKTFLIKNWSKYQSIDKYEKHQKLNNERQKRYREKNRSEIGKDNVTVTLHSTEEENIKENINIQEENKIENIRKEKRGENENGFREYKM